MLEQLIHERVQEPQGLWGVAIKNLHTGETIVINGDHCFNAASVIKLPIMLSLLDEAEAGGLSLDDKLILTKKVMVPGCGVLRDLSEGLEISLLDLCTLMIIVSDNTATNMLIDMLGMDKINATMQRLGLTRSKLRRRLFDSEAAKRGVRNEVTATEMLSLIEGLHHRTILTPAICEQALDILLRQQMNHKMPRLLPWGTKVAHKTGEDSGITHDVGLVDSSTPFVISMLSEGIKDTQHGCQLIADITKLAWDSWGS